MFRCRYAKPIFVTMPFASLTFKNFSKEWDFSFITTSPRYAQSNGLVERNVQTVKKINEESKTHEL